MNSRFAIGSTLLIAFFCFILLGSRPFSNIVRFIIQDNQTFSQQDMGDAEEEQDNTLNDDDSPEMVEEKLVLTVFLAICNHAFTANQFIPSEPSFDRVTPPPRTL